MESGGASPVPAAMTPSASSAGPSALSQVTNASSDGTVPKTKICVYCGASSGKNPIYMQAARDLAKVMADNNIGLVYGGGTIGLMGELAKSLVALAGPDAVHGIIPEALVRYERDPTYTTADGSGSGLALPSVEVYGKTTVVKDMHTRKRIMAEEVLAAGPGSGFIAMSGGYGTFEELLETSTWSQLGIHTKGVCVLNINGFYDGLFSWIRTAVDEGFISEGNSTIIAEAKTPAEAIVALQDYKLAPAVLKLSWGSQ